MRMNTDAAAPPSPLMICDSLLRLAQEADRAGCENTAEHLFQLALDVFDDPEVRAPRGSGVSDAPRQHVGSLRASQRVEQCPAEPHAEIRRVIDRRPQFQLQRASAGRDIDEAGQGARAGWPVHAGTGDG